MTFLNRETTIKFIEDYRKHDVLWDCYHDGYNDKHERTAAHRDLCVKYGMDESDLKAKIKSLRTYFWREFRRCGGDEEGSCNSSWFAFKYLLFLKDSNQTNANNQSKDFSDDAHDEVDFEQIMVDGDSEIVNEDNAKESTTKESSAKERSVRESYSPCQNSSPTPATETYVEPGNAEKANEVRRPKRKRRGRKNPLSDNSEDETVQFILNDAANFRTKRKTRSSKNSLSDNSEGEAVQYTEHNTIDDRTKRNRSNGKNPLSDNSEDEAIQYTKHNTTNVRTKRKWRNSKNPTSDNSDEAVQYTKHDTTNVRISDEYSSFGDFISYKIRKLRTKHLRSLAQQQICNLMFDLEMSKENEDRF